MIDNVVYFSTSHRHVVALDAEDGSELWTFDPSTVRPPSSLLGAPARMLAWQVRPRSRVTHRGVAVWGAGDDLRVFICQGRSKIRGLYTKVAKRVDDRATRGLATEGDV